MEWKNKNVFITGANGFVGSWLAAELVKRGASVTAIVRDSVKDSNLEYSGTFKKMNLVRGNITDYEIVSRIVNEYDIDTCFHLAAQAIVGSANRSPLSTFESNIKGTWTVLEACRANANVKRVVVASSDKAYGPQEELPYTEDSPLLGIYPYDASKVCTDILARCFHATYGMGIAVTRCENIYGGGDLNFSRIIPGTVKSVLEGQKPIIRSDGTPERSFIYVRDAVSAYMSLAENMEKKGVAGEAFNFGTSSPVKMIDLVSQIIKISGGKLEPNIEGQGKPKGEIDRQFLAVDKAKKVLGWHASYTLADGLKETIAWYKSYFSKTG